jgi:hypothetical protein
VEAGGSQSEANPGKKAEDPVWKTKSNRAGYVVQVTEYLARVSSILSTAKKIIIKFIIKYKLL